MFFKGRFQVQLYTAGNFFPGLRFFWIIQDRTPVTEVTLFKIAILQRGGGILKSINEEEELSATNLNNNRTKKSRISSISIGGLIN